MELPDSGGSILFPDIVSMEKITEPNHPAITAMYGKSVRIITRVHEINHFGSEVMVSTHEGILARRSIFGSSNGSDTVQFTFHGDSDPVTIDVISFLRSSREFEIEEIVPIS